jgi:hypothetical protein
MKRQRLIVEQPQQAKLLETLTAHFQSFKGSDVEDRCLTSTSHATLPYPKDNIRVMFVRKCYVDVFSLLMDGIGRGKASFAISGTPGTGKSLFFLYVLYQLVRDRSLKELPLRPRRIVYQAGTEFMNFDLRTMVVTDCAYEATMLIQHSRTLYIIDGPNSTPLVQPCVALFISSPRSEDFKEYVKQRKATQWYFPTWSSQELADCRARCYPEIPQTQINDLYRTFGGVARFVFNDDYVSVKQYMESALADVDAVKGVRNIGVPTGIFQTSHMLLQMVVSNDGLYRFMHVDIASRYVGENLWQRHHSQMIINLKEMFGGAPNQIARHLFEIYGHIVFASGGKELKCRSLETGEKSTLKLKELDGKRINFGKDSIPSSPILRYYEPCEDDNFPAIDSLSPQGMYQFTVSEKHHIRGVAILKKVCQGYSRPKLYFVVPSHNFANFKKQMFRATQGNAAVEPIANLKQYVLELPI